MRGLLNVMKLHAQHHAVQLSINRVGTVTSYDPGNYAAKVQLLPEAVETGWLPVMSTWVGNGWGLFAPPTPGDLVDVQFIDGDIGQGLVSLRYFYDSARPLNVPSGEFWLVHKSGAYLKLTNDGKVSINAAAEIDVGNLGNTLHTLVTDAFVALFNNHTHNDAQGGVTGVPNSTMGASHLTAVLKAN